MNFILSRFWFFFCLTSWGATVTDCAMRLGELMNWRQYDRVFIARLRLRLFQRDRFSVSQPASPLPGHAVHTRAQSTYFPSSFIFSVLLLLSFSGVVVFHSQKIKSFALQLPKIQRAITVLVPLDRTLFAVSLILICNRQNRIFLLLPTSLWIHVHWIIEEEIKHLVLWVRCHLESLSHRFIHTEEGEIHER